MTQTATIATTQATTFPIESLNLINVKSWQLAEQSAFSLLRGNRVRIASYSFNPDELDTLEMTRGETAKLLAWLNALDDRELLQAEPVPFPIYEKYGEVHVLSELQAQGNEFEFWYDRSLVIYSNDLSREKRRVCAKLNQAETLQLRSWLQERV